MHQVMNVSLPEWNQPYVKMGMRARGVAGLVRPVFLGRF